MNKHRQIARRASALVAALLLLAGAVSAQNTHPSNLQNFGERRGERPRDARQPKQEPAKQEPAKTEAPKPAAPAKPAPEKPARKEAAEKGSEAATTTTGAAPIQYKMGGGLNDLSVRITPERRPDQLDLSVTEGGVFTTDIMLANPSIKEWDQVRFYLDYNPKYFEPLSINDTPLLPYLSGESTATVNRRLGQIAYEAKLENPLERFEDPLLFIKWKAIEPVLFNSISFGQGPGRSFSELLLRGEPLLGDPTEPDDGTLGLAVTVLPADPAEALIMQEEPRVYMGSNDRIGGVKLSILGPGKAVRVGDTFSLGIELNNEAYSMMDAVSFLIEYDPEFLEVVDDDWDNWITREININDGSYRDEFNWDYHLANAVYPTRGMIEYRVGTSTPKDMIGVKGVMAHVTVRAKKPTAGTSLRFLFSKRPGTRTTEVVYLGQDVLGNPDVKNDGTRGVMVSILP